MRRIGTSTRHRTCDHCGRKDLASTIAFQRRDGSVTHLGSDCAKAVAAKATDSSKRRHHVPVSMEHYRPHRSTLSAGQLRELRTAPLGEINGLKIYAVDAETIRNRIDIDFTCGGNTARYGYVPPGEIWVESTMSPTDLAPTIVHEIVESTLMERSGMSYDDAHDAANAYEKTLRAQIPEIVTSGRWPGITAQARIWVREWEAANATRMDRADRAPRS